MNVRGTGPIVAVGEILWDLLPAGPRLGGTTANFATVCARLGQPATLISSLGADAWGERARAGLRAVQQDGAALLNTELIQTASAAPTGLVEVQLGDDGQPRYTIAAPAAWDVIEPTPQSLAAVAEARALCFGTLCQRAATSRSTIRALIEATDPACLRVLDVNVRSPFFSAEVARWSMAHCNVAKISEEELAEVARAIGAGVPDSNVGELSVKQVERSARALLQAQAQLQLLAITMGARGSLLLTHTETHYHPGFPVQVVDTVGAGDAFTAGLVVAWLAGGSLAATNVVGNRCGSFVAGQPGATPVFPASLLAEITDALASR